MKRREHSNIVSGNINWYSYYGEQYGGSLKKKKKLKIELPYTLQSPPPAYIQKKAWSEKIHAPQCSLQHC